jgi:hypothetical protein
MSKKKKNRTKQTNKQTMQSYMHATSMSTKGNLFKKNIAERHCTEECHLRGVESLKLPSVAQGSYHAHKNHHKT